MSNGGDDLSGVEAFDRVLSRCLEERAEAHVMRERIGDLNGALRDKEKRIGELERKLADYAEVVVRYEAGQKPLTALYETAGTFLRAVGVIVGRDGRAQRKLASKEVRRFIMERAALIKAVENASDHVDLIPF